MFCKWFGVPMWLSIHRELGILVAGGNLTNADRPSLAMIERTFKSTRWFAFVGATTLTVILIFIWPTVQSTLEPMDLSGNYITTDADRWYLESFFFPSKNLIDFLKDWVNTLDYRVKTENIRQNRCLYLLFDTFWLPLTENSVIIKKRTVQPGYAFEDNAWSRGFEIVNANPGEKVSALHFFVK